jgi:hypothetical protein
MKNIRVVILFLLAVGLLGTPYRSPAANTDGQVTFSLTTQNYNGSYDPNNVAAVWVVDSNGNFIRTLCRHAGTRVNYLYQWNAGCGTYNVDGYTSATLTSQPQTHAVTWDCRNTNGVVVADGTYYVRAEYTSNNGQGPYLSNGCVFVKGVTALSTNYPNVSDAAGQFAAMTLAYIPAADIGVTALSPSFGVVDSNLVLQVTISNLTLNPATFNVAVSNVTSGTSIGLQAVTSLAGKSVTNLTFNWSSVGLPVGEYSVRAIASTLANETVVTNNTLTRAIFLSSATAGDIAVTDLSPSIGILNAWVPLTVSITNSMADATGPFLVSLTNPPFATASFSNTWRVSAGGNDAEENVSTHSVNTNSTDLELVVDTTNQEVGVRFVNVGIPPNASISSAKLQFTGRAGQNINGNPIALTIKGQAADNAAIFSATASNISLRAGTTSTVAWSPANWVDGETGLNARTPDLKTVVQEIVSRPGWAVSNALVFKITGSGARRAWSYDGNTGAAPQLIVQWTSLAPQVVTQQVANLAGGAGTNVILLLNTVGLTAGVYPVSALAGPLLTETHVSDNVLTVDLILRVALHDLAVNSMGITPLVPPGVITNVLVVITNRGDVSETFTNTLRDITATPIVIGTRSVTNLGAGKSTNLVFGWNTATNAGFALGYHTLQASLTGVVGETNTANNTSQIQVAVAAGLTTNMLVAKTSLWKFLDKGLNISAAPWKTSDYYDGFWGFGAAPLGYALPSIATTLDYGGNSSNRYVTTYFRREFTLDFTPFTATGRVLGTHGVVVYLNGTELTRQNMPAGAVNYGTLASNTVTGADATNYIGFTVPTSSLVRGRNLMTAELHLAAVTNSTAGFALELTTVNPTIPLIPSVAVTAVEPDGTVQSGDALGVFVNLTNSGNTATTCLVLLRDATTGEVLASQTVDVLVPGETTRIWLAWPTFGAAIGARTLQAVTVINGITNLAGIATAPVTVDASSFIARSVGAAGSLGGRCSAVAVSGRYVYLGCGASLEIWDALVPAVPIRVGAIRLPGILEDLVVSNNWVYAAAGVAGVQIVDVSTPTLPLHRATFDTSGFARRVALDGHLLYVADGFRGVRVLNVSSPSAPILAGAYQTTGPAQALAVTVPRLLVLDGQAGLQNLHAANPAAMTITGALSQITAGLALTAVPGAALIADGNAGLYRVDISAPATPAMVTNTLLSASGRGLAVSGSDSALYVAAGAAGLLTLNATTLALQSTAAVGDEAYDVAVAGDTLYVAAGFAGCRSLDISSPMSPQPLALYRTGIRAVDAEMSGPTLWVAADEAGLQVHSLTNLSAPEWMTTVPASTNPRCLIVAGSLAYVAEALGGLKIYNVANPASPSLVGADVGAGLVTIRRLALSGSRLAMTDGRRINLLDVSNPASPVQLATNTFPGYVFDLAANADHIFAACGGSGLRILNNANLGTVGTFSTAPDPVVTVSVNGNFAYVGDGKATIRTLSITNPAGPTLVQSFSGPGFGIASSGPYTYLVDARNQGAVVNVSDPLTPVTSLSLPNLTQGLRVRAQGGVVLTAEDEAGLGIMNASPNDINLNGIPDATDQQIADANPNDPLRTVWDVQADDDFDHDGLSNLEEYLAGTQPTDPSSRFAISVVNSLPGAGSGQFVIRWYSVSGKTYTLHKSTDLTAGFTPLQSGIVDSAPINCYTDTVSTASAFYMISVP